MNVYVPLEFVLELKIIFSFRESNQIRHSGTFSCRCNCTQVCSLCTTQKRSMKASRAGTGGFRPPEVLLKSQKQDQKIDVWAAGVCFIVLLSRRLKYQNVAENLGYILYLYVPLEFFLVLKIKLNLGIPIFPQSTITWPYRTLPLYSARPVCVMRRLQWAES